MEKEIILTGDRPTGNLHIGHYVGSLRTRVELQNSGKYEQFVMIADLQALTDNANNPQKIRDNILEVFLDYIATGLEIDKTRFFLQSQVPALFELPMYFSNLVTLSTLQRNPTIKNEIKMRGFNKSIPVGFLTYPISQTADITAFKAHLVPVGEDQLPMIEQAREIVHAFNSTYGKEVLVKPKALLPHGMHQNLVRKRRAAQDCRKAFGNVERFFFRIDDLKDALFPTGPGKQNEVERQAFDERSEACVKRRMLCHAFAVNFERHVHGLKMILCLLPIKKRIRNESRKDCGSPYRRAIPFLIECFHEPGRNPDTEHK